MTQTKVEAKMGTQQYKELTAMKAVLDALTGLSLEEQVRVLKWVGSKLKISQHYTETDGIDSSPQVPRGSGLSQPGLRESALTPKAFMVQKKPYTDVERVACLAYYLAHQRAAQQFKTKDITKLNAEAAQPKLSNPTVAVRNATNQNQYLTSAGKGFKQITPRGEALVGALPNREKVKAALEEHALARRHRKRRNPSKAKA